jgi:heme exporter protein C
MRKSGTLRTVLSVLVFITVEAGLYLALIYAPTERTMGHTQRIFYFHLPLAWIGFLAFFIVFISGILYLVTRSIKWDIMAHSSAEIGVIFSTLVLVTGSIWARRAWNTWWTWEPRLTTMLVLWLIYLGYLLMRSAVEGVERRARISAVVGIAGFIDVPIVFMSILWWRTMHPVMVTSKRMGLAPPMLVALLVSLFAFTLLYVYLLMQRMRLGKAENAVEEISVQLDETA